MKVNLKCRPKVSIFSLRLFIATGVGLLLGIQFRLLTYTAQLPTSDPHRHDPLLIQPLNETGLQHAIQNLQKQTPLFLFGHTTGHSGSGSFHEAMAQPGCPWDLTVDKFEYVADGEKDWAYDIDGFDKSCELTKNELVPHLVRAIKSKAMKMRLYRKEEAREEDDDDGSDDDDDSNNDVVSYNNASIAKQLEGIGINSTAFIDLGHFHNTGRTLECLAKLLGERSVFVHIRRNRYSIARSFTPSRNETLNKTDWRLVRRHNKLMRRQGTFGPDPDDHNRAAFRQSLGLKRFSGSADQDAARIADLDEISTNSNRRLTDEEHFIPRQEQSPVDEDYIEKRVKAKGRKALESGEEPMQLWSEEKERRQKSRRREHENTFSRIARIRQSTHSDSTRYSAEDKKRIMQSYRDMEHERTFTRSNPEERRRARPCRGRRCREKANNETKQKLSQTPCIALDIVNGKNVSHPSVSICPRSSEGRGNVNLAVASDDIWDSLTPFQQFLWYADEMEHRWYTLQKMFYANYNIAPELRRHVPGGHGKPTFIEVTWDSKDELQQGINWVRANLGCTPAMFVTNEHPHVKHEHGALNCSQFIYEDLEYRKKMKYGSKAIDILFPSKLPQHVDSSECREDRAELEMNIREYSKLHGIPYDPGQWKLPDE